MNTLQIKPKQKLVYLGPLQQLVIEVHSTDSDSSQQSFIYFTILRIFAN